MTTPTLAHRWTGLTPDFIKAQIAHLLAACPELRDDDEALILSLESETDAAELCNRIARKIKETEAHSAGIAGYMRELRGRQDMLDLRSEKLRGALIFIMETAGIKTLPLPIANLSISYLKRVVVNEPDLIPEYYRRQPPWEPDKKLIGASLKAGANVPGCVLSNAQPSLTIRMK